ncbi:DUF4292 domain-containing protein [Allomuricauda sp. d1]|uniref:DUF4292 domain-containing protein n=1 Tax=Allomuricauda sp. d1 TaxID=3136725 RepID=UPI0031D09AF9
MALPRLTVKSTNYLLVICLLVLSSCKSTKTITGGEVNPSLSAKRIIQNHYGSEADFNTLSARVKIEYSNGDDEQGVTVNFRMKKGEAIWMSAPFGVVKAYITPEKVSFYNKLEGEYFEGDFSYLSTFAGMDLDFHQLQNVLLGNAISDLRDEKYDAETDESQYILKPKRPSTFLKSLFFLEPQNFRIAEQQLSQPLEKRMLNVKYSYQSVENVVVPGHVTMHAVESGNENKIALEFKSVEVNENLNFPYKIPKGFKEITLSK